MLQKHRATLVDPAQVRSAPSSCDGKYWTMVDAIQQYVNDTNYLAGLDTTLSTNLSGIPAAAALAKQSDAVVLCVGTVLLEYPLAMGLLPD